MNKSDVQVLLITYALSTLILLLYFFVDHWFGWLMIPQVVFAAWLHSRVK